jgi:hypothetical protein
MDLTDLAARFFALLAGSDIAHGTFNVQNDRQRDGKKQGQARVLREPPTMAHWERHLKGENGLGIIPINSSNRCRWGSIDIDVYNLDHASLIQQIENRKLPAIVSRSKSGGAHVFFLFAREIEAADLQPKLVALAALLGFAGSEVFPKQQEILVDRGDTGNFLNMPYFAGSRTTRFAYNDKGESLGPEEFLEFATTRLIDPDAFLDLETEHKKADELIPKGPPCLQQLAAQGFGEGGRNNALFNLGVYARMASPDKWEDRVHHYNTTLMIPPLSEKEVGIIVAQLQKKEYFYKCSDQPIASYCNKEVCIGRKFGIGPGQKSNDLGSLTKINGDPPIWILDVDGRRVELGTDSLVSQKNFQKDCLNQINIYPKAMSEKAWAARMQTLLSSLTIIEVPPDATSKGEFEDLLTSFCCDRARGNDREEILQGIAVWWDEHVFFQLRDVQRHLKANGFLRYSNVQLGLRLKEMKAEKIDWRVKGKTLHLWFLPQTFFAGSEDIRLDLPPLDIPDPF